MVECPTCGDEYTTEKGMKIHHHHEHGESISGVEVECEWCDKTLRRNRSVVDEQDMFFCDSGCQGSWNESNLCGDEHPSWTGGPISVDCHNCNSTVKRKRSEVENYERNFCDHTCYGEWRSSAAELRVERVQLECLNCGDTYERRACDLKEQGSSFCSDTCRFEHLSSETISLICDAPDCEQTFNRKKTKAVGNNAFCSTSCHGQWRSLNQSGEDNPYWRGGYESEYGPQWPHVRQNVIERDDATCQWCGVSQEQHYRLYGRDVDVHHVLPVRTFTEPDDAHYAENLVTLCQICHLSFWEGTRIHPTKSLPALPSD